MSHVMMQRVKRLERNNTSTLQEMSVVQRCWFNLRDLWSSVRKWESHWFLRAPGTLNCRTEMFKMIKILTHHKTSSNTWICTQICSNVSCVTDTDTVVGCGVFTTWKSVKTGLETGQRGPERPRGPQEPLRNITLLWCCEICTDSVNGHDDDDLL